MTDVADSLGRTIRARWLRSDDGARAVVEMAEASGLSRLAPDERDAIAATSAGTGDLIRAAISGGAGSIVLGIGGSATTDGGAGLLRALGANADRDAAIADLAGLDPRLALVEMAVACDVSNPLLGPFGAAAVYGPQKGASPADVAELDRRLAGFADALEAATGNRVREMPGAGAAGGVGFGLLAIADRFRSFALRPGIDLLMEATGFTDRLAGADLVITGEGRIDAQTAFGKTALGVARRAAAAGVPCIAVGGGVDPEGIEALAAVGAVAVPVAERPQSVEEAMAAGVAPLERCGERLARLVGLVS
jgi:glycerate kinase